VFVSVRDRMLASLTSTYTKSIISTNLCPNHSKNPARNQAVLTMMAEAAFAWHSHGEQFMLLAARDFILVTPIHDQTSKSIPQTQRHQRGLEPIHLPLNDQPDNSCYPQFCGLLPDALQLDGSSLAGILKPLLCCDRRDRSQQ
jgi:hypothetical protein